MLKSFGRAAAFVTLLAVPASLALSTSLRAEVIEQVLVRINGDTVMEYDRLENLDEGFIELQAHDAGRWTEYKHIQVRHL